MRTDACGKEVQKRWRSIRDSYTKAFRQGKCVQPEQCQPGSRRYQYHRQMAFLLRALQNKKPRYSQDKYESFSEVSNSPQHPPPEDLPKINTDILDKPLDLKTKSDKVTRQEKLENKTETPETKPDRPELERPETVDKCNQATLEQEKVELRNPSLEIKIDANSILPDDHFNDDKLFMNSLLPLFKKMDDDTRLLCRIEVLKIIRYALQGHKCFEALRLAEDSFFKNKISNILTKEEPDTSLNNSTDNSESKLSMTTRSADGSRPVRKRKVRSPSPLPTPTKRRGPGRPRKDRRPSKKRCPVLKPSLLSEFEDSLSKARSVANMPTQLFMKFYNLERSKSAPLQISTTSPQVTIKTEPLDEAQST
ncbi:hypothetical protein ACJJTC_015053 [Scirpophaga incertulas]